MTIRKLMLGIAVFAALATPVLAEDVGFPKKKFSEYGLDAAAADRKAIAELWELAGVSFDSPCDKYPDVYDTALGGGIATEVLAVQLQPPLTKEELHVAREAVIKAQAEGWDAWCLNYAIQMVLAKNLVLQLANERGLGPKK